MMSKTYYAGPISAEIGRLVDLGAVSRVKLRPDLWRQFTAEMHGHRGEKPEGRIRYQVSGVPVERRQERA